MASTGLIERIICDDAGEVPYERLGGFSDRVTALTENDPSTSALHLAATWRLVMPRVANSLDSAVILLRRALAVDSADVDIRNDLAAALVALAQERDDPFHLFEALEVIESRAADEESDALAFNRALVLQLLHFPEETGNAWGEYFAERAGDAWGDEARVHQARATAQWRRARPDSVSVLLTHALAVHDSAALRALVDAYSRTSRDLVLHHLIPSWGAAVTQGHMAAAGRTLDYARQIGDLLSIVTGDHLIADALGVLVAATGTRDRGALIVGHAALARGIAAYHNADLDAATDELADAIGRLTDAGSPALLWAWYYRALIDYQHQRYVSVRERLEWIRQRIGHRPYLVLHALTHSTEGLVHSIGGRYAASRDAYGEAAMVTGRLEPDIAVEAYRGMSSAQSRLGDRSSWRNRYQAQRVAPRAEWARTRHKLSLETATEMLRAGFRSAPLPFLNTVILTAREIDDPLLVAAGLQRRSELLSVTSRYDAAHRDLHELKELLTDIPDAAVRNTLAGDWSLVSGELNATSQPTLAVGQLDSALQIFEHTFYDLKIARAHLALARAHAALGSSHLAVAHFKRVFEEIQTQSQYVGDPRDLRRFLDLTRPALAEVLGFSSLQPTASLEIVETFRARTLLDSWNGSSTRAPVTPAVADWRRRLDPGVTVLSYFLREDETLLWTVDRDSVRVDRIAVSDSVLRALIGDFKRSLSGGSPRQRSRLADGLERILVRPVRDRIERSRRLVIVPDRWLHALPFAALRESRTRRYLVEDFEIIVSPGATFHAVASDRFRSLAETHGDRVFAVGDPAFDAQQHPSPRLPWAVHEVNSIAALNPNETTVLTGSDATIARVMEQLDDYDVFHLAAHAILVPDSSLASHLLLAASPDGQSKGALSVQRIGRQRLSRVRLVVLSGCHTAGGKLSDTEGPVGFARAFFHAGVPATMATLWAVNDRRAAEFATAFHENLRRKPDPARALRATQLQFLARTRSDQAAAPVWPVFQLIGGT